MTVLRFILPLVLFYLPHVRCLGEENFTEFVDMVYEHINASSDYVSPTDNSAFFDITSEEVQEFGTFDFIIVGSGAAGSVLASRLSEIEDWKVLLLEAGGWDNDFSKIITLNSYTLNSDFSWGFHTASQQNGCLGTENQTCHADHGKVLGGSTTLNGAGYARGHPEDYDRWVEVYGNVGWSYEEVLPYFKKSENATFSPVNDSFHGRDGYLTVTEQYDTPLTQVIIDALEDLGYTYGDHNGPYSNVVSRFQYTLAGNERVSASTAFLKPFLNRTNLYLSLNSFVTNVNLNSTNKQAHGVDFVMNGTKYRANATKEVILSAGGYHSSQILLLSGIGPKDHLEEFDIPVVADLPVGRHFQDHIACSIIRLGSDQVIYNYTFEERLKRYVQHERPLIYSGDAILMANLDGNATRRPDTQTKIRLGVSGLTVDYTTERAYITIPTVLLHPKSRGNVTLVSNSPKDYPLIDVNPFGVEEDIETVYRLQQLLMALNDTETVRQNGLRLYVAENDACTDEIYSESWWYCMLRYRCNADRHPVASNSMGSDKTRSVVDPRGRVHDFVGLRVADESIMPESISGQNMAPTIMIAERISDFIKEDYFKL